jgi:hypothetical protein
MGPEADEPRRAASTFALYDASGQVGERGSAVAVIDDERVSVGPVVLPFLDADALRAADYRLEIDRWPYGRLVLTGLGRRYDTFARELARARNQARVIGVLAHGLTSPEVFEGAIVEEAASTAVELQVYDTHVAIVPADGRPWQIPFGALIGVSEQDSPPGVVFRTEAGTTTVGLLARRRDALAAAVAGRLDALRRALAGIAGQDGFADGRGVPRSRIDAFDDLLDRVTARERVACASAVLAASDGEPRLGFVQLLDPDAESLEPPVPMPEHWAAFILVPVRGRTVLEVLSGPSAATYVFTSGIEATNRDLQALHFRRAPLALAAEQARLTPRNPYRLALRTLEPLRRLRDSTTARIVHDDGWSDALAAAVSAVSGSPPPAA